MRVKTMCYNYPIIADVPTLNSINVTCISGNGKIKKETSRQYIL